MKTEYIVVLLWIYLPMFFACIKMAFSDQTEFNDRKIVNLLLLSVASATFAILGILLAKLEG